MLELTPPAPSDTHTSDLPVSLPVLEAAIEVSPYLQRLCRTRPETLDRLASEGGEACVRQAIAAATLSPEEHSIEEIEKRLRQAKADIHLSLSYLDLSCAWDWDPVTRAFSDFADAAITTALSAACHKAAQSGWVDWDDRSKPLPGLFILSLGKLGAHELNYSSDIDIVSMYDPDTFPAASRSPGDAAQRIIQAMTQILERQTEHGYVLRVDHRLRPDPRSTPIAVSTNSAELYYESVGQNWERMAYIKARARGGDLDSAKAFLKTMEPFVWRRHLDFWALEDIRAIKNQIHSTGGHMGLDDPEFDVKLGRGGIREIEFFAQTQQLIHGGRNSELRHTRTVDALTALAQEGHVARDTAEELAQIYARLRGVEHRIQMLNDEHTHRLTKDDQRERVAKLCGEDDLKAFDHAVSELRHRVHHHYAELFHVTDQLPTATGNLVFTGVDIDPGTVETLARLGFSSPEKVIADVQAWHRGASKATRTSRARQLLTALEPRLFDLMSETGNPDAAFDGFKLFLNGLTAGVQTLSLLAANPVILDDLINIFSMAPSLARDISNRPNLLESLLDGGFTEAISEDSCGHLGGIEAVLEKDDGDFEWAMNEVRRNFRDAHFRIRFRLLNDISVLDQSGRCFAQLADRCIEALQPYAQREAERTQGKAPGRWVICGLGKLGSQDLTARSDLDLMVVFDPDEGSTGASQFFAKATQRLITALSAQTEEGLLYEADMQLRPSGRAGPVAVRLSAFADYYRNDAWTWEHMALTRLRVICGDEALAKRVTDEKEALLCLDRAPDMLVQDAWDMRERLLRDRPAKTRMDVKLAKGAMIDIEFLAQIAQLLRPDADWGARTVLASLQIATDTGLFTQDELTCLSDTYRLCRGLQAYQRAALERALPADEWPAALKRVTARALGSENFDRLEQRVKAHQAQVWEIFCRKLQPGTTEWAAASR